jgi:ribonuclease HI
MAKLVDKGGGGVVIRDHDGRFLAGSCHFFPTLTDPEEAELRACEKGRELVRRLKLNKVILERDSASTVYKLNSDELDRSMHGSLIEKLKREIRSIGDHVVKWVRRSANAVAHTLAKEGSGLEYSRTWFISFPDCIKGMLARDLLSV